jgi:hypothetical protein
MLTDSPDSQATVANELNSLLLMQLLPTMQLNCCMLACRAQQLRQSKFKYLPTALTARPWLQMNSKACCWS